MDTRTDLELLRAYEPVLSYTKGELFFPTDIDSYVAACSLWKSKPGTPEEEVVPAGELTVERLAAAEREWPGHDLHLRFVQEDSLAEEARRFRKTSRPVIPRSGRLAAVGVLGRIVDVLMRLSLLIRGAVPGGVAAAAATRYRERLATERSTYYGRVTRDGGYIALQYWFFYVMNDWRSTFGGVNDHEADWEKVVVYLLDHGDGPAEPVWVGASSHEYTGDDLRRSWNDPDLRREGDHPVLYPGAGSHSNQLEPGDYLIQVDPAFLSGVVRAWRRMVERMLPTSSASVLHGIGIPFVDYARGDGVRIGPGTGQEWERVVIDDQLSWVVGYRGLWGRDTRDWFEGERAPSGPRYERDGTVRRSWIDPLSWVGLHKVPPGSDAARGYLEAHLSDLDGRIGELDQEIDAKREEVRRLSVAATVLRRNAHTRLRAKSHDERIDADESELARAYRERGLASQEASSLRAALERGDSLAEDLRQHLRSPHRPYATGEQRPTRFLHVWAALSTTLLLVALASVFVFSMPWSQRLLAAAGVVLLFAAVDAIARGRFRSFMVGLMVVVAVVGVISAIVAAFIINPQIAILVPVGITAAVLLIVNVRDLLRR
ncbi:hypothetical protein J4H86_03660 [Spiractinospora alimapuensis]|uniref:hypothetical protein n=1 Tax=Spiractinospora alimapuensis TaxID=2820884 RepID=UPI001F25D409|nr:hypothetical protein [Spiractinospora alimapuensis]QVQ52926.1 hypothetical protein J4H86_03660 [Spiractinospora alimapuensis]